MIVYVVIKGHRSETRVSSSEIEASRCAEVEKDRQRKREKYISKTECPPPSPHYSSRTSRIVSTQVMGCACVQYLLRVSHWLHKPMTSRRGAKYRIEGENDRGCAKMHNHGQPVGK